MYKTFLPFGLLLSLLVACSTTKNTTAPNATNETSLNSLSVKEQRDGWRYLFDGKTTTGWHTYNQASVGSNWKVVDGTLEMDPKEKGAGGTGDIISDEAFENYELSLEWRISEGGNATSGTVSRRPW